MIPWSLTHHPGIPISSKAAITHCWIWPAILAIVLTGCATAPPVEPEPSPVYQPDRFEPVPNYQYLPSPASAAEREVLARLEQELTFLQRLAREAQAQRNPTTRTPFRYDLLMRDLDAIRHGIRQHLQGPGTEPRAFEPLRGNYRS